jgi:hypothetical protein
LQSSDTFTPRPDWSEFRVALVGPAYSGTPAEILEGYDVIARLGYVGHGSGPSSALERCEISFLARWHAESLLTAQTVKEGDLSGVEFFARPDVAPDLLRQLQSHFNIEPFSVEHCNRLFKNVVPNFGPQVIVWLLAQKPRELHISHIDLLTDPRRPGGYPTDKSIVVSGDSWEHDRGTIRRSFAQFHNPFTHFYFFLSLQRISNITFSSRLKEIVRNGAGAYRRRLSFLYYQRPDGGRGLNIS